MYIKCRKNLQFCCDRRKYCYFDYKQNGNKKGKLELLLSVKQAAISGSQETQLPSAIHPVGDESGTCNAKKSSQEYQLSCVSRVFHNCPTHLTSALFTRFPFVFRVSSLPVALSPPTNICLKIIAAVVVVGGAAAVIALFSFLLLLLLSLYCAALCGIFCQVHIWDGSKRPKNNCAALIKKLNSAQGRGA